MYHYNLYVKLRVKPFKGDVKLPGNKSRGIKKTPQEAARRGKRVDKGGKRVYIGGQGRNAFCTLFFRNQLIIFYLNHHNHVKCGDFHFFSHK